MSMFGARPGSWSLSSDSDPRWNCSGRAKAMLVTGGLPDEVKTKIEELKEEYGEPPDDLSYSCMKD